MSDVKSGLEEDPFLAKLETAVSDILKNRKSTKTEKLAAINAGVKVAQIKHRINGGADDEKGFFNK